MAKLSSINISDKNEDLIHNYYSKWVPDQSINLRFRYVKLLILNKIKSRTHWVFLHRFTNKRRVDYQLLKSAIMDLLKNDLIPVRIFHSVCEWFSPHEIHKENNPMWLKNSGFIPIENDDTLSLSIKTAQSVSEIIPTPLIYVYSGNKSIHTWHLEFDFHNYIHQNDHQIFHSARSRERFERKARIQYYNEISKKLPYGIDYRSASDPRRIVPIINTINCYTGRITTRLTQEQIYTNSAEHLMSKSKIIEW